VSPRHFLLCATALFLAACGEKNSFAPPAPTEVGYQLPIVRDETIYSEYPGRIEANQVVSVRARVKGILTVGDDFHPGKRIAKDTPLFSIEKVFYEAARDSALAAQARAAADLKIAVTTLERRVSAGQAVAEIEVKTAEADVAAAEAMVATAAAELKAAMTNLGYCDISAPISGRISELTVDEYNLVGDKEATVLCTIVDDSSMRVYFEVDERRSLEFLRRRKGYEDEDRIQPTGTLTLADGARYEDHEAKIEFADNRLDTASGTLMVRANVPNPDGKLADGLFVRIRIPRPEVVQDAILIPATAIQQDLGGHFALTIGEGNKVVRKNIALGDRVNESVQNGPDIELRIVESGLTGEDKIIVLGLQRVRENVVVAPREVPREPGVGSPTAPEAPTAPNKED